MPAHLRVVGRSVPHAYELFLRPKGSQEKRVISLEKGDDLLVLRPRKLLHFYRRLQPADAGLYEHVRLRRTLFSQMCIGTPEGEVTELHMDFSEWRDPFEQILERFGTAIPSLREHRWEDLSIAHRLPWRLRFRAV